VIGDVASLPLGRLGWDEGGHPMGNRACFAVVAGAVLALIPVAAEAAVKFCSDYTRTIFIAVAYPLPNGSWSAKGWLTVPNGQCSEFNNPPLQVHKLLYRGETDDYPNNGQQVRDVWGDKGTQNFAVTDEGFTWDNADSLRGKPGNAKLKGFTDTNVTGVDTDISITIRFKTDGATELEIGPN
jgi:uncharacterized membrane protein